MPALNRHLHLGSEADIESEEIYWPELPIKLCMLSQQYARSCCRMAL